MTPEIKSPYRAKVSIVIPVYNGGNYLAQAIDSALAQTYPNIEVLVINDGSEDNEKTEQIALSYGDRIRYYKKPNGGVATALNLGIEKMRGDFFSWLSHDDLYDTEKVAVQIAAFNEIDVPKTIIYSNYEVFSGHPADAFPVNLAGVSPSKFRYWITAKNALHGCTLLITKIAFEECGFFNPKLRTTQDYDLWFRMAEKFSFVHIPQYLVKARSHSQQDSLKMSGIVVQECNALLSGFVKELQAEEILESPGQPLPVAYARLAANLQGRGFLEASATASDLRRLALHDASAGVKLAVLATRALGAIKYRVVRPLKRTLPASFKGRIRHLLAPRPQAASAGADAVRGLGLKEKFSEVYDKNIFGGGKSRSGEGSDMVQTEVIRREIPRLIEELGVRTFLDAPCGDWYWMRQVDLPLERYIGVDIVEAIVLKNRREFGNEKITFECLNLAESELPRVDMIFSRDCLVHLSYADALKIIANFKRSGARYLLTTTFTARESNQDLGAGFWRPLNQQLPPFSFPPPQLLINEKCTEGRKQFTDKCLGLWEIKDIELPELP